MNMFQKLEIPLFKLILGVKDSIEAYYFKLVESRTPNCLNGGVKNSVKIW